MAPLTSTSGQSSGLRGVVQSRNPQKRQANNGLKPHILGPPCKKECPMIIPAISKRPESVRVLAADGTR